MMVFSAVVYANVSPEKQIRVDEQLLIRIGREDKAAFHQLYEQLSSAVYAYALSILRNQQDAEDAMQDTFLKIRAAAHLYRPMDKPTGWIFTIARNICMMRLRQRRYTDVPLEEMEQGIDFGRIKDAEDRMVLQSAFEILTAEECQIVFLHAAAGIKHKEIAGVLGIPLSTVLSKYNRSIRKLRTYLGGKL